MLKINVSDVVKILTVDDSGVCDDGTKRSWVRCSAMSFFDEDETYMTLTAFGYVADMILDNHTGSNARRAFVNGSLEITEGSEIVNVDFNGKTRGIKIPKMHYQILADTVRFIDKNNWGETSSDNDTVKIVDDTDEPIDLTGGKQNETAATKSSKDDLTIKDDDSDDDFLYTSRKNRVKKTARDKMKNKR